MSFYYSPEDLGAEMIGDVDTIGGYEFNMLAVFVRTADGALFWGEDQGCSCNSPFEDETFESLTPITDPAEFAQDARKWLRESYGASAEDRDAIERLVRKVRRRFHKPKAGKGSK